MTTRTDDQMPPLRTDEIEVVAWWLLSSRGRSPTR